MKKWMFTALIVIFAAIFLVSGFFLVRYLLESKTSIDLYNDLASMVEQQRPQTTNPPVTQPVGPTEPTDPNAPTEPTEPPTEEPLPELVEVVNKDTGKTVKVLREYAQIYEMNPHLVGWIRIENTQLNYPVMQTPNWTNYYLYRDFYRNDNSHGCIYAREQCDINKPSDNITIYGHWMRDGSMFGNLQAYKQESYYKEHPYIIFDTLTEHHTYEIISVYRTTASIGEGYSYHLFVDAANPEEYNEHISTILSLSEYDTGKTAQFGDKLISLSTCEYSQTNGRLVIVAKRIS